MTTATSTTQRKPQPHFIDRLRQGARQQALRYSMTKGECTWPKTGWVAAKPIVVAYYPASNRYNYWLDGQPVTQRELLAYLEGAD